MRASAGIREGVLSYLDTLRAGPGRHGMTAALEGSLFSDCFAFFVRHLLGDASRCDDRGALVERIRQAQDAATGWWSLGRPGRHPDHTREHVDWQLSSFVAAVLATEGVAPAHPLRFLEPFHDPGTVRAYLEGLAWARNPWNSGNRALFLAALLSYAEGCLGEGGPRRGLDAWFDWHGARARRSGFWGQGHRSDWYVGLGGAAHQYLVYHFHGREPPHLRRAVERTLAMQHRDGRFWPVPGGGSCYELDALEILLVGTTWSDHRRDQITGACRRTVDVALASRNPDGGFCWAARRWFSLPDAWRVATGPGDLRTRLWAMRALANAHLLRRREARATAWSAGAHPVSQSSVFDTWFRLLTLATASRMTADPRLAGIPWTALPAANWGFF